MIWNDFFFIIRIFEYLTICNAQLYLYLAIETGKNLDVVVAIADIATKLGSCLEWLVIKVEVRQFCAFYSCILPLVYSVTFYTNELTFKIVGHDRT